jgi:hypothetical protein
MNDRALLYRPDGIVINPRERPEKTSIDVSTSLPEVEAEIQDRGANLTQRVQLSVLLKRDRTTPSNNSGIAVSG